MNAPDLTDLSLVLPEMMLTGAALVLILLARRIRKANVVAAGTVVAALAAALAAAPIGWVFSGVTATGFSDMIIVDGYSQFFKGLIAAALALTVLLSVKRSPGVVHRGADSDAPGPPAVDDTGVVNT